MTVEVGRNKTRRAWAFVGWVGALALALASCDGDPGSCVRDDGTVIDVGATVPAGDGCNTCTCREDGLVACTLSECVPTCDYDGSTHEAGDTFPATDGCNTCTCGEDGAVACTTLGCPVTCEYDGATHGAGDTFPATDGCNTCTCEDDGTVACTEIACPPVTCLYDRVTYDAGDTFPSADDGCNTCTCTANGTVACTEIECTTCLHEGVTWDVGDSFPEGDGCNTCACEPRGLVVCTKIGCPGCEWRDETYPVGATWPAGDGCNTCSCNEPGGGANCTRIACQCDRALDWWRVFEDASPEECQALSFDCEAPLIPFRNACGCGCQQDRACPRALVCEADDDECDLEAWIAECPLSSTLGDGCTVDHPCRGNGESCYRPGERLPCGMCRTPDPGDVCDGDGDCGDGEICEARASDCMCGGESLCHAGCLSIADCAEGQQCGGDGHCEARECLDAFECPVGFRCDAGGCLRKSCSADDDCEGFCVEGQCHGQAGYCSPPPP